MRGGKGAKGGAKQAGMKNMDRKVPAEISDEQTKEIQDITKKAFKCLNSRGVSRIDFIIDNDTGKTYINEINTIPGSFAFYLWEYSGMTYTKLIDRIVEIAEKANEEKNKNNYTFNSDIIGNIDRGGAKK